MTDLNGNGAMRIGGDTMRLKLDGSGTAGEAFAFEVEMAPGGGPPLMHRHESMEMYRVESGELTVYLGEGDDITATTIVAGEVAFIPGGHEHTIRNESDHGARAFAVLVPGRDLEDFARAVDALEGEADPATIAELAEVHGIELTRPIGSEATRKPIPRIGERGHQTADAGYLTINRISGDADQLLAGYRESAEIMDGVGRDHGLIVHAAAPTDEGMLIFNLWPSRSESEAAAADPRRAATIRDHDLDPSTMSREHHRLERCLVFEGARRA